MLNLYNREAPPRQACEDGQVNRHPPNSSHSRDAPVSNYEHLASQLTLS